MACWSRATKGARCAWTQARLRTHGRGKVPWGKGGTSTTRATRSSGARGTRPGRPGGPTTWQGHPTAQLPASSQPLCCCVRHCCVRHCCVRHRCARRYCANAATRLLHPSPATTMPKRRPTKPSGHSALTRGKRVHDIPLVTQHRSVTLPACQPRQSSIGRAAISTATCHTRPAALHQARPTPTPGRAATSTATCHTRPAARKPARPTPTPGCAATSTANCHARPRCNQHSQLPHLAALQSAQPAATPGRAAISTANCHTWPRCNQHSQLRHLAALQSAQPAARCHSRLRSAALAWRRQLRR
jgi:hypothetical protein